MGDARVWARIGALGFGGPAGQVALMHREVVHKRGWLDDEAFNHALALCMLLPGPEAHQLATYIGWRRGGLRGASTASLLFVLPGAAVMLALSMVFVLYGDVSWVRGALMGLQASVIAIVCQALIKVARRQTFTWVLAGISIAAFIALAVFTVPFPYVVIAAGLIGWALTWRDRAPASSDQPSRPATPTSTRRTLVFAATGIVVWLAVVATVALTVSGTVFPDIAVLFAKSAVVTFGGAYAVLGYVAQQAVGAYGWLSPAQMATGLGLAETTPGPLILVLQFVGFVAAYGHPGALPPLVAGLIGSLLTLVVLFLPSTCFVLLGAPFVERLRTQPQLRGVLRAISAAVVGVIASLALWLALHTLFASSTTTPWGPISISLPTWSSFQSTTAAIAGIGFVLVFGVKWGMLRVLAVCATLGLISSLLLPV